MSSFSKDDWLVAEVLAEEVDSFALWAIAVGLCSRREDYRTHFASDFPTDEIITSLTDRGFIRADGSAIALTELGKRAAACLGLTATLTEPNWQPEDTRGTFKPPRRRTRTVRKKSPPRGVLMRAVAATLLAFVVFAVALALYHSLGLTGLLAALVGLLLCVLLFRWLATFTSPILSQACFPSSAAVMTPNGIRLLGDITVGDRILSWSEATHSWVTETVISRRVAHDAEVLQIWLEGKENSLYCTPNHPMFTPSGIKAAAKLKPGDEVLCWNDGATPSTGVVVKVVAAGICSIVMNLYVSGEANYVCCGLLVHCRSGARNLRRWFCQPCEQLVSPEEPFLAEPVWPLLPGEGSVRYLTPVEQNQADRKRGRSKRKG
jgi:hypothetical protein